MCGIAGIGGEGRRELVQTVREMGRWLLHRGPDAWGEYSGEGIALGHTRLAILDIAGGTQPMSTPDGALVIVFNGEIYNFRELRRQLEARGHQFRSDHSDTEVILHGYREWGTEALGRLEGMFAFAIWDARQQRLFLARDRLGIKTLYYAGSRGLFLFASEPKAIVRSGRLAAELDASQLESYFMFRASVHPGTLFQGIRKLDPGCWLAWGRRNGLSGPHPYWRARPLAPGPKSLDEAAEQVEARLEQSVRAQLVADVPVGIFLSGGVDSSLLAALASKHGRVETFTIATGSRLDEHHYAEAVARQFGLPIHTCYIGAGDFLRQFDDWAYYNDDPVSDPSALALMMLARQARDQGMKVMLSGEGGDELFAGYNSYLRFLAWRRMGKVPGARALCRLASPCWGGRSADYLQAAPRDFLGSGHLTTARLRAQLLLLPGAGGALPTSGANSTLREALIFDQRLRLGDDILPRTDRATMAVSLEGRVPFLDTGLVELANSLPDACCVHPWLPLGKRVLKKIVRRHLGLWPAYRPKRGFDLPLRAWLLGDLRPLVREKLERRAIAQLNYGCLHGCYAGCAAGNGSYVAMLWAWLTLERWHSAWICGKDEARGPADVAGTSPAGQMLSQFRSREVVA
ncbi:MAG: asparagine synthase (glutamine-hydrolyzing) [Chlamydiota bacterium]